MPNFQNDPVVSITDSTNTPAVQGQSSTLLGIGVKGHSHYAVGVLGESLEAEGIRGVGHKGAGVSGTSEKWIGVYGESEENNGVFGKSKNGEGVHAETNSQNFAALAAFVLNPNGVGAAVHAENHGQGVGIFAKGGRLAGLFDGNVEITGHVQAPRSTINCYEVILSGADCAENFDISGSEFIEPGSVMVLDDEGSLRPCASPYDKKVGGVISGAGAFKPGITLGQVESASNRQPIALLGKVYCKADAAYGPIEVGDMLTTSPTVGHAMKAADPNKAFGAVIGKALRPLQSGQELIPILITLQ